MIGTHVSFKIPRHLQHEVSDWLKTQSIFGQVSYDWATAMLSMDEEDSVAFYLRFGIQRHETQLDRMIRLEEDHN